MVFCCLGNSFAVDNYDDDARSANFLHYNKRLLVDMSLRKEYRWHISIVRRCYTLPNWICVVGIWPKFNTELSWHITKMLLNFFINHILPETQTINIISKTKSNLLPGYIYVCLYEWFEAFSRGEHNSYRWSYIAHAEEWRVATTNPVFIRFHTFCAVFCWAQNQSRFDVNYHKMPVDCQMLHTYTYRERVWSAIPVRDWMCS